MHIFGCLIFIVFGIFFIFIALFGNVLRMLFGLRKASKQFRQATGTSQNTQTGRTESSSNFSKKDSKKKRKSQNKEKIFQKNEGEYVDFEEIKD